MNERADWTAREVAHEFRRAVTATWMVWIARWTTWRFKRTKVAWCRHSERLDRLEQKAQRMREPR